jgi:hypothetical protein
LWVSGTGGNWDAGPNWNQGVAPVTNAVVTIPDIGAPGVSDVIAYRSASGTTSVKTITSFEELMVSGGALNVGTAPTDVSAIPLITLAGGALGGAGTINVTTLNLLAAGLLKGTGTFVGNVNNTSGTVSPGASPGTLTINGNYVQGPAGALAIELGGLLPGSQHDQLAITGSATLDGALNVSLINGFVPADNNTFKIMQSGSVSGTFATVNIPVTSPTLLTDYLATSVNLTTEVGASFSAEQIFATQINTANNAIPGANVVLNTVSTNNSSGQVTGAYLETAGGQIVALSPTDATQSGVFTNVATGETTIINADALPKPGVYVSADASTVLVVTLDPETGLISVMTGSAGESGITVGAQAKVNKPGVCK